MSQPGDHARRVALLDGAAQVGGEWLRPTWHTVAMSTPSVTRILTKASGSRALHRGDGHGAHAGDLAHLSGLGMPAA